MKIKKALQIIIVNMTLVAASLSFAQDVILEMKVKYPYVAPPERKKAIISNYKVVSEGMTSDVVVQILGKPDEIIKLYEPKIIEPKQIGYTYWYYIERESPKNRVKEKLVRVSFDMNYHVMKVAKWGFE